MKVGDKVKYFKNTARCYSVLILDAVVLDVSNRNKVKIKVTNHNKTTIIISTLRENVETMPQYEARVKRAKELSSIGIGSADRV